MFSKILFRVRSGSILRWVILIPLLAGLSFYAAMQATFKVKANANVRATPFVLETASYNFETNPQGDLFYKRVIARRSDGSTAEISQSGPTWNASSRTVTLLSGMRLHVFDLISTKISWSMESKELARLKERLVNPPANCIFRPNAQLISNETLFGQETVVVQITEKGGYRTTRWMAPDLGCESLQWRLEDKQPDGSYKLTTDERLLSFKIGEPDGALFDPAANYQEAIPSEVIRRHYEKLGVPEPSEVQDKGKVLDKRYSRRPGAQAPN